MGESHLPAWPSQPTSRRVERLERTLAAIRAERPAELPTQFDAEYQAATLGDAKTYRLDRLNETIEGWWRRFGLAGIPRHE